MCPSAAETLPAAPQPAPACIKPYLPSFQGNGGAWAMDARGRQQGSHIFMSVRNLLLFEKESQVYKCESCSSTKRSAYGFILIYLCWVMSRIAQACISEAT